VDVVRGDGRVLVSEQPSPRNEYSAIIRVDPRGTNYEYFVLNFFWNADPQDGSIQGEDPRYRTPPRRRDVRNDRWQTDEFGPQYMTWRGRVDHEALIEIRGRRANVRTLRGQRAVTDSADFSAPLPRQVLDVQLEDASGRGRVELVQEPSAQNNYTTIVRIMDEDAGADTYAFRIAWEGSENPNRTGTRARTRDRTLSRTDTYSGVLSPGGSYSESRDLGYSGENRMIWSGRVDGAVQLVFRDDRVTVNRMSGSPVTGDRLEVGSPLPNARLQNFRVNKLEGRGNVRVLSEPSAYNNYEVTVEISDSSAGADIYSIELTWDR
jgi:hypothetical protein